VKCGEHVFDLLLVPEFRVYRAGTPLFPGFGTFAILVLCKMSVLKKAEAWHLDIDRYLNRVIPASPLHRLPTPVSRFLGYRKEQKQDVGNVLGAFWSLLGAFCGLAVVAAVFNNTESIQRHAPPAFIASFVSLVCLVTSYSAD
jgi:hypothetical protein